MPPSLRSGQAPSQVGGAVTAGTDGAVTALRVDELTVDYEQSRLGQRLGAVEGQLRGRKRQLHQPGRPYRVREARPRRIREIIDIPLPRPRDLALKKLVEPTALLDAVREAIGEPA
jgi:hypothetical protein